MNNPFYTVSGYGAEIAALEGELRSGLDLFWQEAASILEGSTIRMIAPDEASYSLPRNFFSTLFLYSYFRSGIPLERRILYVATPAATISSMTNTKPPWKPICPGRPTAFVRYWTLWSPTGFWRPS